MMELIKPSRKFWTSCHFKGEELGPWLRQNVLASVFHDGEYRDRESLHHNGGWNLHTHRRQFRTGFVLYTATTIEDSM